MLFGRAAKETGIVFLNIKMWKLYSRIHSKNSQQCSVSLPDMPDELLLKIFNYLDWDILSILKLSQTSKRFNAICQEESLWQKASLVKARIPTALVQKILEKGCRSQYTYLY